MSKNYKGYLFYKGLSMLAFAIPLLVLFAVNFESYTSVSEPGRGVSFFGYVIIMFLVLGFRNKVTHYASKNIFMTVCLVVFIMSVIMLFLAKQLLVISGVSLIGCIVSTVFEYPAAVFWRRSRRKELDGTVKKIITAPISHRQAWRIGYAGEEENATG